MENINNGDPKFEKAERFESKEQQEWSAAIFDINNRIEECGKEFERILVRKLNIERMIDTERAANTEESLRRVGMLDANLNLEEEKIQDIERKMAELQENKRMLFDGKAATSVEEKQARSGKTAPFSQLEELPELRKNIEKPN
jgi:hypothetical protein